MGCVGGVRLAAGDTATDEMDSVVVIAEKPLQRISVARTRGGDQRAVIGHDREISPMRTCHGRWHGGTLSPSSVMKKST